VGVVVGVVVLVVDVGVVGVVTLGLVVDVDVVVVVEVVALGCLGSRCCCVVGLGLVLLVVEEEEETSGTRGLVKDADDDDKDVPLWERRVVVGRGRSLGQTRVEGAKEEQGKGILPVVVDVVVVTG
jgi:hypothetical protein